MDYQKFNYTIRSLLLQNQLLQIENNLKQAIERIIIAL
jgi:hypothetical protein